MKSTRTTKRQIVLLAAVATLLLLSTVAWAQTRGNDAVDEATVSGGGYRLTVVALPASGTMSGGRYQLQSLAESTATGSGCCCTYLPCLLRNR
jgi:hypothetical protein